jgi:CDP-glycerol glycerophosphotransferase (TagB/SpsB family)
MIEADPSVQSGPTLIYKSRGGWLIQWTVEIDTITKRLKLFRTWFGRWTKAMVDSALDDCVAVGTVEYNTDGHINYGTYFKLRNGNWHAIPVKGDSFEKALQVVKQVAAATGIPRLDVKYS